MLRPSRWVQQLRQPIRARELESLEVRVLKVLTAMGYGGRDGAAEHLGGAGTLYVARADRGILITTGRFVIEARAYAERANAKSSSSTATASGT